MTGSENPAVEVIETHWIPLEDGRRLATRLFLPASAHETPVPLIVEQHPYRRRDLGRFDDEMMHPWFAARGYAVARIDVAGTGDSTGLLEDEYTPREHRDLLDAIEHLATQPWSTGDVGMIGMSWGGFSALQIAALRPERLKAIVTVNSSVHRYARDAHYLGGLVLADNLGWGGALSAFAALPPDPEIVGPDWRDEWVQRVEAAPVFAAEWLHHQRYDDYWKHGSVVEDYSALTCPVLTVGGWFDGYVETVLDLLENHPGTCKGIIGPWGHTYPFAAQEHAIGFLQECERWFGTWLKGADTGVRHDPALRCFVMDASSLPNESEHITGSWLGLGHWPPEDRTLERTSFDTCEPSGQSVIGDRTTISSPADTGRTATDWCAGMGGALVRAADQTEDDRHSLCFDLPPLEDDLRILGTPQVVLQLSADQPQAMVATRITSIDPSGASTLLTFGVLNLSHRAGHEQPEHLTPGVAERTVVPLRPVAVLVPAGHHLRVALSTAYWPMTWPGPTPAELTLDVAACSVEIPVLPASAATQPIGFEEVETADAPEMSMIAPPSSKQSTTTAQDGRTVIETDSDGGRWHLTDIDLVLGVTRYQSMSVAPDDPAAADGRFKLGVTFSRGDWRVGVESLLDVTADADSFVLDSVLRATEDDEVVTERREHHVIPRDHI